MNIIDELAALDVAWKIGKLSPKTFVRDIKSESVLELIDIAGLEKNEYLGNIDIYSVQIGRHVVYDFNLADAVDEALELHHLRQKQVAGRRQQRGGGRLDKGKPHKLDF